MKKHLKKIVLLLAVTFAGAMASAWDWTSYCENLDGDRWIIRAGVGYGYSIVNFDIGYGLGKAKGGSSGFVIPVQGEFLLSKIPLGITLNFRPQFGKYSGMKNRGFALMAGANYHVAPGPEWLDLYAGAEMGIFYNALEYEFPSYVSDERSVSGPSARAAGDGSLENKKYRGVGFAFGAHVGASFLFTKHFGVNAEVGYPTLISTSALFKF